MEFAQILNDIMTKRNITNYRMSKETGISDTLISYWRKGERIPSANNLILLSNYFDVSIDYLLGRTDDKNGITQVNTGDIGDNSNVNINSREASKFDKTTTQVAEIFQDLDVLDKAKVLNLIAELSEKKGA